MKQKVFISLAIFCIAMMGYAQKKVQPNWQDVVQMLNATEQNKMSIVYVYKQNCELCDMAEETIFSDTTIVNTLNKEFNVARFDAATKDDIIYKGSKLPYQAFTDTEGVHVLAVMLLDGKMGYPTFVVMDKNGEKVNTHYPVKDKEEFMLIMKYYSSGDYKETPYDEWKSKH
jgi:thioredoxin-related protein